MAFAGHCGLEIRIDGWADATLRALFNEELGAVVQIAAANREAFEALLVKYNLAGLSHQIGRPKEKLGIKFYLGSDAVFKWNWSELFAAWNETSSAMQRLRDNPQSADAELDWRMDDADPGISPKLTFDPVADVAGLFIASGTRPRVAILREQGVNGQIEMAAAFDRAGFDAVDVHMSDLAAGRVTLDDFRGFAACGGFSFGDVLGAGRGWAASILYNEGLRAQFAAFFADPTKFALGVCNGCQMMSALKDIIPGAQHWPQFLRNASEQYEARLATLEILDSPSLFFKGMAGSRIPVAVAHGEGRVNFPNVCSPSKSGSAARFVDNRGAPDRRLSAQPERFAGRAGRFHRRRRPRHDHDAAPGTGVPQRADELAPGVVGRGFAVDAHVPQRTGMVRLKRPWPWPVAPSWPAVMVATVALVAVGLLPWWIGAPALLGLIAIMAAFRDRAPAFARRCDFALNAGMFGLVFAVQRDLGGDLLAWGFAALVGLAGFSMIVLVESLLRGPRQDKTSSTPLREWRDMAMDRVGPGATIIELSAIDWRRAGGDVADGNAHFETDRFRFADGTVIETVDGQYAISPDGRWFLARARGGIVVLDREHRRVHRLHGWGAVGWYGQPWFERQGSDLPVSLHDVLGQR